MSPSFFKKLGPIDVDTIKSEVKCRTVNISDNDSFDEFVGITNLKKNSLSFLNDIDFPLSKLSSNACIICTDKSFRKFDNKQKLLIVGNVQKSVAIISNLFYRHYNDKEISNLDAPQIGKNCQISKNCTIENGVIIGSDVKIHPGAIIKQSSVIGKGSVIGSNSVISNAILGEDIYIGNNTSIGQRGFGFYIDKDRNIDIFHTGRVIIQSNVSIGSCCTIDRGSFSDTIIGKNSYIDNLCHVAHNVVIGENSAFAAMTGIAGSAEIGNNVLTGGQVGIAGHIKIGNNVQIAAKSGVFKSLNNGEIVMGNPALNKYKFLKNYKKVYGKK